MNKPRRYYHTHERVLWTVVAFVVQIIWGVSIFSFLNEHFIWLSTLIRVLATGLILFLSSKNENPTYRLTWIVLIAIIPVFGTICYLLIGNKRPTRRMHKTMRQVQAQHEDELDHLQSHVEDLEKTDKRAAGIARYIQNSSKTTVSKNNDVSYYPSGEAMFNPLLEDLKRAEKSIFIEFFIVEDGLMLRSIMDILIEKAQAGVDVRFIYDDFGCIMRLPANFPKMMEEHGIKVVNFNPVKPILSMVYNTRNHRKYIVIDSQIAYTGGVNIADEYINVKERFGYWKDNMIRVQGPAVYNYTLMFLNMWNSCQITDESYQDFHPEALPKSNNDGFVQPYSDSPLDSDPLGENVYRDMVSYAQNYVYIYTPYLIISYELQTTLTLAAQRGVRVVIITPGTPDKPMIHRMSRSYYRDLLEGGVEIYEYTPGFIHAKTFIVDGVMANVGTINLDYRSLYLHFETSTMLYYHPEIKKIEEDFLETTSLSRKITLQDTNQKWTGKLIDSLLRLLAPFA